MKSEKSEIIEIVSCIVQLAVYLVIIGAITRFRSGISSRAQRGWFMSWPLIGIIYGCVIGSLSYEEDVANEYVQEVKIYRVSRAHGGIWHGSPEDSGWSAWFIGCVLGAATIGGVVAMVQQYLHLVQC
jgi:hypothetical protein